VDAGRPFGVVDERIAVALPGLDRVVAQALGLVDGILLVPLQQHRQQPHVGDRRVAAGAGDQRRVVGQAQVRFGGAGHAVGAAFVAHVHVQHGARDVALDALPGLPDAAVAPVGVAGEGAAAAAAAVVGHGGVFGAPGVAVAVGQVAAFGVVGDVRQHQHVQVGVGEVGGPVVGETERVGPGVLAVVVGVAAAFLLVGRVAVDVGDRGRIVQVLVGEIQHVPAVGGAGGVRDLGVVVDQGVQRGAQRRGRRVVDAVVIAVGSAIATAAGGRGEAGGEAGAAEAGVGAQHHVPGAGRGRGGVALFVVGGKVGAAVPRRRRRWLAVAHVQVGVAAAAGGGDVQVGRARGHLDGEMQGLARARGEPQDRHAVRQHRIVSAVIAAAAASAGGGLPGVAGAERVRGRR